MNTFSNHRWLGALLLTWCVALPAVAQTPQGATNGSASAGASSTAPPAAVVTPPGYVIGPDDVLAIVFWREKELSAEAAVRPDGNISLPLLNDVLAAGLTPDELRVKLNEVAEKFIEDPTVAVIVKQINSRKVFITGNISKPGPYPLGGPTTVMQLIAVAGGVAEYADTKNISILRTENGREVSIRFNYQDVSRGKNLQQNITLKPGDTITVP